MKTTTTSTTRTTRSAVTATDYSSMFEEEDVEGEYSFPLGQSESGAFSGANDQLVMSTSEYLSSNSQSKSAALNNNHHNNNNNNANSPLAALKIFNKHPEYLMSPRDAKHIVKLPASPYDEEVSFDSSDGEEEEEQSEGEEELERHFSGTRGAPVGGGRGFKGDPLNLLLLTSCKLQSSCSPQPPPHLQITSPHLATRTPAASEWARARTSSATRRLLRK